MKYNYKIKNINVYLHKVLQNILVLKVDKAINTTYTLHEN